MGLYYSDKLAARRLQRCYELAPPPVQNYLAAEIEYVCGQIKPGAVVLELGCGYGRVVKELAPAARRLVGIDTSLESLQMGQATLDGLANVALIAMDAVALAFPAGVFDLVYCIQNGISAFQVEKRALLREAVRVTRPGGSVLFSSYAPQFWHHRLHWFRIQAADGLLGEIDEAATGDGVIVCKDGFKATTVDPDEFSKLATGLGVAVKIEEVARSSLFCQIFV